MAALITSPEERIERLVRVCRSGCVEGLKGILKEEGEGDSEAVKALVNGKNKEGTTPLHEASCHSHLDCMRALLKCGADANIWDARGFSPIHAAAYNDQKEAVKLLWEWRCDVDCLSEYNETPLHIACLRGHIDLAQFLEEKGASVVAEDGDGNSVLHSATSSDSEQLLEWLLRMSEVKRNIDKKNKYGHTAAHRAVLLGCVESVTVLHFHDASFSLEDESGHTAFQLAEVYNNTKCLGIAQEEKVLPLPSPTPPPTREGSSDSLLSSSVPTASSFLQLLPQKSQSSGGSTHSLDRPPSGSPKQHRHRRSGSMTGQSRPVNLSLRRSSLRRGSSTSTEEARLYLRSREDATRILQRQESVQSKTWEDTQQHIYDSTAYNPPPDIEFVEPIARENLTLDSRRIFCKEHELKMRVSEQYWSKDKDEKIEVCLCAGMHLNRSFPSGYTIVSPVCFVSCKSSRWCEIHLTIPHAAVFHYPKDKERIVILSTVTVNPNRKPESPFFSPSERTLIPLPDTKIEADRHYVTFKTKLAHPSLFAVAVKDNFPDPLPLRCSLFVAYPLWNRSVRYDVTGFDLETYIGMSLTTVTAAILALTQKHGYRFDEHHFTLEDDRLRVTASLSNLPSDWEIECRGRGEFKYVQVALTQETDSDTYSHAPAYPPREKFFIEPKNAGGAVRCRIAVTAEGEVPHHGSHQLCNVLVVPFAPSKEPTPEPTPPPSSHSSQVHLLLNGHTITESLV